MLQQAMGIEGLYAGGFLYLVELNRSFMHTGHAVEQIW